MKKFIPTPRVELSERHQRIVELLGQLSKWEFKPSATVWTGKSGHLTTPALLSVKPHKSTAVEIAYLLSDSRWTPGYQIHVRDPEDATFLEYYSRLLQ